MDRGTSAIYTLRNSWANASRRNQYGIGAGVGCLVLIWLWVSFTSGPIFRGGLPFFGGIGGASRCGSTETMVTTLLGGVPGFYVFENVWFGNGTYHFYTPYPETLPAADAIVNANQLVVHHSHSEIPERPSTCYADVTLLSNEGWYSGWQGLWHYYHFATENILPGFLASSISRHSPNHRGTGQSIGLPKRLVIPWENGWKDKWGMNQMITDALFPNVDVDQWNALTVDGRWIYFENVAFIDRWASHRHNPLADTWNKMALPIFLQPHRLDFWSSARDTVLRYHGVGVTPSRKPKVVYINRQETSRKLRDEDHEGVVSLLGKLREEYGVEAVDLRLEQLGIQEQLAAVADATIMLGIHGNGLTHSMWMKSGSTLIEVFPPDTFLRDYASVADAVGHDYWAISNGTILTREMWYAFGGEHNQENAHSGVGIPLDPHVLGNLILQLL